VVGRDHVTRFLLRIVKRADPESFPELAFVNGEPGVLVRGPTGVYSVLTLTVARTAITNVWIVVNPAKLERLQ
jgi:hypothetical protein